ncbi:MAG: 3-oxoacyl-ACP synthase [Alphaproteobacteria bacterium]|nr:3-oxoacyl-ACP synthase [Alphaproteobacteria bacterium]
MPNADAIDPKALTSDPVLLAPHYVLGEHRRMAADIEGLSTFFEASQMIDDLALWGLDRFHSTDQAAASLGIDSGRETLRLAGVRTEDVSALLICATQLEGDTEAHAALVRRYLEGLGLDHDIFVAGITLGRCTCLLSGLRLAESLVRSNMHNNVLVIAADRFEHDHERLKSFALFSDGAASCIVSRPDSGNGGYRILDSAYASQIDAMAETGQISADLTRRVTARLTARLPLAIEDVKALMHSNIYTPVVAMKEQQGGFARSQLCFENIADKAHCFGADPIINLVDRERSGGIEAGDLLMLASSIPGARVGMLLSKRSEVASESTLRAPFDAELLDDGRRAGTS